MKTITKAEIIKKNCKRETLKAWLKKRLSRHLAIDEWQRPQLLAMLNSI